MGAPIHNIDPAKFILSIGLVPTPVTGFQKGTMIKISRDANAFEKHVGGDGEVTRVRNRNRAGAIQITLQQGSASNAALSALAIADELSGSGVSPVTFRDMSGTTPQTEAHSVYGWVRKMPDATFGSENEEGREWIIDLADMPLFIGGN